MQINMISADNSRKILFYLNQRSIVFDGRVVTKIVGF